MKIRSGILLLAWMFVVPSASIAQQRGDTKIQGGEIGNAHFVEFVSPDGSFATVHHESWEPVIENDVTKFIEKNSDSEDLSTVSIEFDRIASVRNAVELLRYADGFFASGAASESVIISGRPGFRYESEGHGTVLVLKEQGQVARIGYRVRDEGINRQHVEVTLRLLHFSNVGDGPGERL